MLFHEESVFHDLSASSVFSHSAYSSVAVFVDVASAFIAQGVISPPLHYELRITVVTPALPVLATHPASTMGSLTAINFTCSHDTYGLGRESHGVTFPVLLMLTSFVTLLGIGSLTRVKVSVSPCESVVIRYGRSNVNWTWW